MTRSRRHHYSSCMIGFPTLDAVVIVDNVDVVLMIRKARDKEGGVPL